MKKVSIIIPVYNNFKLTLQCVNSILENCKNINYEIIISDDCSTDETNSFFTQQREVLYRKNNENRGFAFTCNRGAEVAKGEYLLFLNNDTLLIDNILTKFVETFKNFPFAGIVGAKLLYEDNTIQHGGVLVYPNKKVGHLFRFFPSNYADANKVRKLQAVTGACLAIPRKLFFDTGKFDENFINGFEDLDLCFRIKYNYKKEIIYNPEISLYHLEEQTRGARENLNNSYLLQSKWFSKITGDFYLIDENYDFRINEIGEFYIIKEKFNFNGEKSLKELITKEPLYFEGYKSHIALLTRDKNYKEAELIAKELIKFEPIMENIDLLRNIYLLSNDFNRVEKINNTLKDFTLKKIKLKKRIENIYKYLIEIKDFKVAKYFKQWLENFNF